jgi:hypothetical protein
LERKLHEDFLGYSLTSFLNLKGGAAIMQHTKNTHKIGIILILFAIVASGSILAGNAPLTGEKEKRDISDLFFEPAGPRQGLDSTQAHWLEKYQMRPTTKEIDVMSARIGLLEKARHIGFNLFPGQRVVLKRTKIEARGVKDYSWFGASEDPAATAIMVVNGDKITGNLRWKGELFQVRPLLNGLHAVILVDQAAFPPEHATPLPTAPAVEKQNPGNGFLNGGPEGKGSAARNLSHTNAVSHTIKVVVAYTSAADSEVSDIDSHIQLAIDETNTSYSNSSINPRLSLAHKYETSYTESTTYVYDGTGKLIKAPINFDLEAFQDTSDGDIDDIDDKRNTYGADVAVLMTKNVSDACGLAWVYPQNDDYFFSVVRQNCATGYYSFGHEIGHLQGALHDPDASPETEPFAYGHGYHKDSWPFHFRTVMGYSCGESGCDRIQHWSNPNVSITWGFFWSSATGTSSTSNNARVLNETAAEMAAIRARAYVGNTTIFTENPGRTGKPAKSKVYISSYDYNRTTTVKLSGSGHNQDSGGYARVMNVRFNGGTVYKVISWINSGSTVSFSNFSIPKSQLQSGLNDVEAYIHWSNASYDNGHWVSLTLTLNTGL